jgi:hypothetical protein
MYFICPKPIFEKEFPLTGKYVYTSVFDCDQKSQVALLSSDNMGIEAIE